MVEAAGEAEGKLMMPPREQFGPGTQWKVVCDDDDEDNDEPRFYLIGVVHRIAYVSQICFANEVEAWKYLEALCECSPMEIKPEMWALVPMSEH